MTATTCVSGEDHQDEHVIVDHNMNHGSKSSCDNYQDISPQEQHKLQLLQENRQLMENTLQWLLDEADFYPKRSETSEEHDSNYSSVGSSHSSDSDSVHNNSNVLLLH